jgi:hypothetical protein
MNNITTIMHKATITQDIRGSPQRGATSTNSSSSLLSSVNHLHAQSHKILLRIGQEICAHLARSSFPELGYNTKPSHSLCTKHLQSLALSSASVQHTHAQSLHNYLHLAHRSSTDLAHWPFLHRLDIYLYITKGPKHG